MEVMSQSSRRDTSCVRSVIQLPYKITGPGARTSEKSVKGMGNILPIYKQKMQTCFATNRPINVISVIFQALKKTSKASVLTVTGLIGK